MQRQELTGASAAPNKIVFACADHKGQRQTPQLHAEFAPTLQRSSPASLQLLHIYISPMFRPKHREIDRLNFVLAGAQKSGTTALHYFLTKHPHVTMGDRQEVHFFDDEQIFSRPTNYESLHQHFPPVATSTITGERTPIYIYR